MREERNYPVLKVDLDAVRTNARVVCELCAGKGIEVAGVIKFSDGRVPGMTGHSYRWVRTTTESRWYHV